MMGCYLLFHMNEGNHLIVKPHKQLDVGGHFILNVHVHFDALKLQPNADAASNQPKHGGKPDSMLELINQGEVGADKSDSDKLTESEVQSPAKKKPGRPPKTSRTPPSAVQTKPVEEAPPVARPPAVLPTPMMTQQSQFEAISDSESPEKLEPAPKRKRGRPPKNKGKV